MAILRYHFNDEFNCNLIPGKNMHRMSLKLRVRFYSHQQSKEFAYKK